MITVPELAADALGTFLASYMQRRYRFAETRLVELVPSIARIALECIGNSDALYHNVEHTMLVTLAGHDILRRHSLSQRHGERPAMDRQSLLQCFSRRTRHCARGTVKMMLRGRTRPTANLC